MCIMMTGMIGLELEGIVDLGSILCQIFFFCDIYEDMYGFVYHGN